MTVPFSSALNAAFTFAFIACVIAAGASWARGGKYHHVEQPEAAGLEGAAQQPQSQAVGTR